MLFKNQIITCRILRTGYSAEGIAEIDGMIVFVENALPDELVEIKIIKLTKKFAIGKLLKILEKSQYRLNLGLCQNYNCGGCQLIFVDYDYQLKLKENIIQSAFRQNAKIPDLKINSVIKAVQIFHYRNKIILPAGIDENNQPQLGFYMRRSHRIANIDNCKLHPKITDKIIDITKKFLINAKISIYDEIQHTGIFRNLMIRYNNDLSEIMIVPIINADELPHNELFIKMIRAEISEIKSVACCINKNKGNVILTDNLKKIDGADYITAQLSKKKYQISVNTFFQVNYEQTEKLYEYIRKLIIDRGKELSDKPIIFDLYSGISSIGIYISDLAEYIYSAEENPSAEKLANINFKINNITNIRHITGKSIDVIKKLIAQNIKPNIVILDPPRKGCEKEELEILGELSDYIIYVSCQPTTLARDAQILLSRGFTIKNIQPLDMFPNTFHIETICEFVKN